MYNDKSYLKELVKATIKEVGFNEDGDLKIDLTDLVDLSNNEIIDEIKKLGYNCEYAGRQGEFWISK
jgi:hypothetical protein